MVIQVVSPLGAPTVTPDLFSQLAGGFERGEQAAAYPSTLRAQQALLGAKVQDIPLQHQLLDAKAEFAIPKAAAALALIKAQTKRQSQLARSPFGGQTLTGAAGAAYSDILFKNKFKDDPAALATLKSAHDRLTRSINANIFYSLPVADKSALIAKARTMGLDAASAVQYFANGGTLQELSDKMHASVNSESLIAQPTKAPISQPTPSEIKKITSPIKAVDITPTFAAEPGSIEKAQMAASSSAGLKYLGDYVANNIKYGGITAKIRRPWIRDAYSNDPNRQQRAVDYYTALAILPELALFRMKVQGGQSSARAIKAIEPTILGSLSRSADVANLPARIQRRIQRRAVDILNESAYQMELQLVSPNPTIYNPKVQEGMPENKTAVQSKAEIITAGGQRFIRASDGKFYSLAQLDQMRRGAS